MRPVFLFAFLFFAVLIVGCKPDPRKEAQAYAIKSDADLKAQVTQQELDKQAALDAQKLRRVEVVTAREEALAKTKTALWRIFWFLVIPTLAGCSVYYLAHLTQAAAYATHGLAEATVMAAQLQAKLVHLDKSGTFPLIPIFKNDEIIALIEPNRRVLMPTDQRDEGSPQMIDGATAIQHTYVLAQHAVKHEEDPTGVSIIGQSPVFPSSVSHQIVDVEEDHE